MEGLDSILESILFAADHPVRAEKLIEIFEENAPPKDQILETLNTLRQKYQEGNFGFELREAQGGYQFCTKKENALWVQKFLEAKPFRLSRTALETLAVIAYRQPITRAEIDHVRGMDSSHLLRVLIEKGIVKMAGKAEVPGRPVQYATTQKFLELIGINSLSDLPPLSELKELQGDSPTVEDPMEESLDRFISEQITHNERMKEEDAGLEELESLIKSANSDKKEVYASPLHEEVANENEAALAALQAQPRPKRKKQTEEDPESLLPPPIESSDQTANLPL